MKNLVLKLFSVVFILGSFSVYSKGLPDHLQQDAEYLMEVLSRGNVDAYREKKENIEYRDKKKIFKFVDGKGNNILHYLVRLERMEGLNQRYNLDQLLHEEIQYALDILPSWKFMGLLTKKNREGFSPLDEAAISQAALESPSDWKTVTIPSENRGLAYKALQIVVGGYAWPVRAAFDAMVLGLPPVGAGIIAYSAGNETLTGIGVAAAVAACGLVFKRLSDSGRVRKALSLR